MSNIKKGAKLTVSTGNGISRHTTENLGVLEVSGPAMSDTTADYTSNTAQLTIGATDVSGVLKLGINNDGNTFIDAIKHGNHTDIIMQKYGGDVIIGSGASSTAKVGIRTNAPDSTFHINSTDGLIIPVGTNGERPNPAYNGMIRYNTTTSQFEGYGPGSAWGSLGGVKDVDGDTYILAESSAGADNDDLQFFTAGQERMSINSVGDISMNGATYISGNLLLGTTTDSGYQLSTSSINCTNNLNVSGTITGNVTGNVTGNCSGTAATVTTAAQPNITSLGTLTSLNVSGTITGNVTGNCSGTAATVTTAAQPNITSLGTLTSLNVSGTITGNVTGNVTGNCSGTAATVTTAAQPNITSLGTLTSLNVSGNIGGTNGILVNNNGVGISHAAPTNSTYQLEVGGSVKVDSKLIVDGNVGIGTTSPDRGLCILDNQNTGQAIGNYYIGYNTSNQEPGALKIFQHLPITSGTYRISDGGGNLDPAINIITNFIGSGATSATHQGGCIQWTTQSRENPTSGAAHGQPYAAIYGGRHSDIANHEGEMIFYTSDTTNRASGPNLNPRMTIKGGNVGIGTSSPYAPLYIHTSQPSSSETPQTSGQTTFNNTVVAGFTTTNSASNNYGLIGGLLNNGTSYLQALSRTHSSYYNLLLNPNGGNVGIGTTSPTGKLEVNGDSTWQTSVSNVNTSNGNNWQWLVGGSANSTGIADSMSFYYAGTTGTIGNKIVIKNTGRVGIGTTSPSARFHVHGNVSTSSFNGYRYTSTGVASAASFSSYAVYIYGSMSVYGEIRVASDRRIKENIVDVPDDLALQMVRDIPCRYYQYKDKINRSEKKTIGFIAQEVNEIMPIAVSIQTDIIPNEMRKLENVSWEQIENTYKLITDLQDVSGVKYRFYVSNDVSGNGEIMKDVVGNSDNSFTFDEQWNNVFCYGKEVDDFHTIDKNKLFALNFSATQEIDRIQQQHIIDISNAQATIQTLQTDLSTANTTIQQQATTIQQHETTIQQQQQQIADILSRLENLESSA